MAGADDLATLPVLSESSILDHLAKRFASKTTYTYVADILIALNPYTKLDIYNEQTSAEYTELPSLSSAKPHIFAITDTAYQRLKRTGKKQCFLISGESGAGKTESTKLVLQHILRTSRHKKCWLQEAIAQINPILEAFGNAKTTLNNNSSRFGKYVQLFVDSDGAVTGVHISQYMLEKSRIVRRNKGESNFHIFYYLFGGLQTAQLHKLFLVRPDNHRYLIEEDEYRLTDFIKSGVPRREFEQLVMALHEIGFSEQMLQSMWGVISAILHIGDIKFMQLEDDSCVVRTPAVLTAVCTLLSVDQRMFSESLTSTTSITRGESIRKVYTLHKAETTRDGVAKALYSRLFDWIVNKINILSNDGTVNESSQSLDILDIFGFEQFKKNSFEQLCINIANEQLQYFFNEHIFTWEQVEYDKEGVMNEMVTFCNNERILDLLLTRPTGMLQLLDEESGLPRATDATLVHKIDKCWGKHPNLRISPSKHTFTITHYAGEVCYTVEGLLDKNRDTLSGDVKKCLGNSQGELVCQLFKGRIQETGTLKRSPSTNQKTSTLKRNTLKKGACMTLSRPGRGTLKKRKVAPKRSSKGGTMKKNKEPTSVAIFFRNSLKELMKKILETEPHFIRCIKPNNQKQAMTFVREVVQKQLNYTGVLETTKIRQCGYSTRLSYSAFINRYSGMIPHCRQLSNDEHKLQALLKHFGMGEGWVLGRTKVFLKYWFAEHLDHHYDTYIRHVVSVQKVIRGFLARQVYVRMLEEEATKVKEEAEKQAKMLEALQTEQRLKEHLDSIRTLTNECDRAGTLQLRNIRLMDLTTAIFDTDNEDPNPYVVQSPPSTLGPAPSKPNTAPHTAPSALGSSTLDTEHTDTPGCGDPLGNIISDMANSINTIDKKDISVDIADNQYHVDHENIVDNDQNCIREVIDGSVVRINISEDKRDSIIIDEAVDDVKTKEIILDLNLKPVDMTLDNKEDAPIVKTSLFDMLTPVAEHPPSLLHTVVPNECTVVPTVVHTRDSVVSVDTLTMSSTASGPGTEATLAGSESSPDIPEIPLPHSGIYIEPEYVNHMAYARQRLSPGEFRTHFCDEGPDSGVDLQRFDSLDSRGSSGGSFGPVQVSSSAASSLQGSLEREESGLGSRSSTISKSSLPGSKAGGLRSVGGSMQSFDDISCCSPSPDASSCGLSSSRSSVHSSHSESRDCVLTTLDRPRTTSVSAGGTNKQAWLQVCCYEKDTQTGNFLIDKPRVQVDGQMLHPDAMKDPDLYRISLTGLLNEERQQKTDKLLNMIGNGILLARDKTTGDVTLTKLTRQQVFIMNDSFLSIKEDEKCKGKHVKMEINTPYTIFNKQQFVDSVRTSSMDLSKVGLIGQVAISFIKDGNSVKGVPCWIKIQCLEAMNLLKNMLSGSTPEQLEWLRKQSPDPDPVTPRRSSLARLSFGSKSSSKCSLKDPHPSSSRHPDNIPIPRANSKSRLFRSSKKSLCSNSPEPSKSQRSSGVSLNYDSIYDIIQPANEAPLSPRSDILSSRRLSSPPDLRRNFTTADVSSPISRGSPLPNL